MQNREARAKLTELQVPRSRVQSREAEGGLFPGAAVCVTKIVQRTFEFATCTAAAEAMAAMIRHTPGTAANAEARAALEGTPPPPNGKDPLDPRFGLEHGGCMLEVSRPIKIELEVTTFYLVLWEGSEFSW